MNIEELFLRTLQDLEDRISSSDPYEILRVSLLIRQLFLDGHKSLVDQVNRNYRLKIEFEIVDVSKLLDAFNAPGMPPPVFLGIQDAFDPGSIPNPPKKIVKRDEFFKTPVQISGQKAFTVQELIEHQAHIMGGVHAGKSQEEREKILSAIESTIYVMGLPPGLRQLKSIGKVILKALEPLKERVEASRKREGTSPSPT